MKRLITLATFSCLLVGAPLSPALASQPNHSGQPGQLAPEAVAKGAKTGINWKITPGEVMIFLDGKRIGKADQARFTACKAGKHTVRLVKGEDETELEVKVPDKQVLELNFDLSE